MNKLILFIISPLILTVSIFSQDFQIKSLKYYPGGNQASFPLINLGNNGVNYITIEFDISAEHQPDLSIVFKYCDQNWKAYDNLFLNEFGKNFEKGLSFTHLPSNLQQAQYHYKERFPNSERNVEFPYSGNWMFYITDLQDTSKIYQTGKFYVIENEISIRDTIKNETLEDQNYFPNDLGKVFNITAEINIPEKLYPSFVSNMTIIENQKLDEPVTVNKNFNTNTRQYYFDGNRQLKFVVRDIRPGNEYRQVDLRNINKFTTTNVRAQFDGIEYSRFYKQGNSDLNGGSIIDKANDPNSTYLNVTFSIRPQNRLYGYVYLVGAFNSWQILPEYQMNEAGGVFSKTIQLKRGIYDYQYVVADVQNGIVKDSDWYILEGNNWDTSNEYNLFIYYKDQNYGGYERIIGHKKIITK
ncbi:MAG TPA: type IX secretion system plug protein domain-containing protein [Ignavibacteriaceae bacterium]|nr:type IX secretion system plug protein domain-containing protein [Ignavibacteriaceae bacterium]